MRRQPQFRQHAICLLSLLLFVVPLNHHSRLFAEHNTESTYRSLLETRNRNVRYLRLWLPIISCPVFFFGLDSRSSKLAPVWRNGDVFPGQISTVDPLKIDFGPARPWVAATWLTGGGAWKLPLIPRGLGR